METQTARTDADGDAPLMTAMRTRPARPRAVLPAIWLGAAAAIGLLCSCGRPRPVTVVLPRPEEVRTTVQPLPPPAKVPGTAKPGRTVVGYYPAWVARSLPPADVGYGSLTHVIHAFARPEPDGRLTLPPGFIDPALIAAAHAHGTRVLLGLGGWGNSDGFPGMVSTPENRARFIGLLVDCLRANGYDGVDIDWEFASNGKDRAGLSLFIEELAGALGAAEPRLQLTMAAPSGNFWGRWIDFERLAGRFDFIGFMTYDYHGAWSRRSGHNAPLRSCPRDAGSLEDTVRYAVGRGIPPDRIVIGLPFGGRSFDCGGLGRPFKATAHLPYSEIAGLSAGEWSFLWDACAEAPYAVRRDGGMIISYDDPRSIALKCRYAMDAGLAGVMIWELAQDGPAGRHDLLDVVGLSFGAGRTNGGTRPAGRTTSTSRVPGSSR